MAYHAYLRLFGKLDQDDRVYVSRMLIDDETGERSQMADKAIDETVLQRHAEADGRTTWDESDICALAKCDRAPSATFLHPPLVLPTPTATPDLAAEAQALHPTGVPVPDPVPEPGA